MRTAFVLAAIAAIAFAQNCDFAGSVTIPAGETRTISSCRFQNMFGQQRCLQPAGQFTFELTGQQFLYNVDSKILGTDGTCYTLPGCGNGDCPICHAMQLYGCWNITSDDFTIRYDFTCRDSNQCPVYFNYTMNNYCGDGICQSTEFCLSCPEDCCPSSTSTPSTVPSTSAIVVASQPPSPSRSASGSRAASNTPSSSSKPSANPIVAPSQNTGKNTQSAAATLAVSAVIVVIAIIV